MRLRPTVRVGDEDVPLPSRRELRTSPGITLNQVHRDNGVEHDAGCHGDDCDEMCAERAYARWSAVAPA
jgi:hypothetical protein